MVIVRSPRRSMLELPVSRGASTLSTSTLREVERFLRRSGMKPTAFGRQAVGDPRFVGDLRNGREPRETARRKVLDFIASQEND